MLTEHEARALLIRNGYELDPNYAFYFLVVKDARFKDVKQLLDEAGYDGFFGGFWHMCESPIASL